MLVIHYIAVVLALVKICLSIVIYLEVREICVYICGVAVYVENLKTNSPSLNGKKQ